MTLPEDVVRLLARDHHDPHSVLGAHPHPHGVVIRALRPGAASVVVRSAGREVPLDAIVPETMFEGVVEGVALPLRYELVVDYPEGESETIVDPYSFLPTLGELDLHLFAEGRHELLFCVLGAHRREVDGVVGTRFAVWAPSARAIAVVGDFNLWNSLTHPMRSLGGSGVWELFVPGVGAGNLYKFAVRGADGVVRLKADPVASRTEAPPHTASVVFEPSYRWSDDAWMERRHAGQPWQRARVRVRGASRLVAARPRLPRARRRARCVRQRPRVHPRRAAPRDGAPVRRLVGLPGDRILRANGPLRHPGRLPRLRRHAARPRHRRHPRLGPRALPARRVRVRPASTAPRSTSTRTHGGASTPTGARSCSTTGGPRCATSCLRAR